MSDDFNLDIDFSAGDGTEDGSGKKKKLSLKVIIILAVLLMVLAGGAAAWFLLGGTPEEEVVEALPPLEEGVEAGPAFENIYSLEVFSITIADMGGRVFKVKIDLDLADPATRREIDRRVIQLRGAAGMILKSKTMDEIESVSGKIKLKTEIIKKMNVMLETGKIRNLYWSEFVVL